MSHESIKIKPVIIAKPAVFVRIEVKGFALNSKSGKATVIYENEDKKEVKRTDIDIPENTFSKWGTDDSVIEKYVLKTLGLKKA